MTQKQTAVEWFAEQLGITSGTMLDKAKEMEKEQITSYIVTTNYEANVDLSALNQYSLIPEISDEEIEEAAAHHEPMVTRRAWVSACKWYREQLKQKQ